MNMERSGVISTVCKRKTIDCFVTPLLSCNDKGLRNLSCTIKKNERDFIKTTPYFFYIILQQANGLSVLDRFLLHRGTYRVRFLSTRNLACQTYQ